jgi:uncharacterized membrane protein YdjX (TVP38/TMEM64 family)
MDPASPQPKALAPKAAWLCRAPFLVLLAVAVLGAVLLRDELTFDALSRHREALLAYRDANYGLASLVFIGAYLLIVAFSLPGGTIASLTGGFLFGVYPGALYSIFAAGTGAVLVFLAARMGFGAAVSARIAAGGGVAARLQAGLRENEWSVLFLMRIVPLVPFVLANLIPAFVGTSLTRFAVSTYLGIIPGAVVFTWVGSGLAEVFDRGAAPDLGILFTWPVLGPLLALSALAALPMVLRLARKLR